MFTDSQKHDIFFIKKEIEKLVDNLQINKHDQSIIAGGVFTSLFHKEPYKDIDVFILNDCDTYLLNKNAIKQSNSEYLSKEKPFIKEVFLDDVKKINFVFTTFKTRKEVVDHFDFSHCCVSYDFDKLYISEQSYYAIKNKKLIVNNPIDVKERRKQKFLNRGFTE
jgi:hypothetical protein